jgi:hypothetical protein
MSQTDRDHLIHNIAGHFKLGQAKSAEIKARQRRSSHFVQ